MYAAGISYAQSAIIFGGIGGKNANLKGEENGIGGSIEGFAGKSLGDFSHVLQNQNQKPSWDSEKQANVAGESSVEEICTVFLEVDVKKEYMESDRSSNYQSPQMQREGFWGEEGEKLLKSSPADSWESLSPRLQIDFGEEDCLELNENPLVEENSLKSGEISVLANQQQPVESKGKLFEKEAKGIFSRMVNNGLDWTRGSKRWIENEQIAHAGETSSDKKRCQTTSVKENSDPAKIGARKSLAMKRSYGEEKEKRY